MGFGPLSHQTTAITAKRTSTHAPTTHPRLPERVSGRRSIRKSSSVGFGDVMGSMRAKETGFCRQGQERPGRPARVATVTTGRPAAVTNFARATSGLAVAGEPANKHKQKTD